MYTNLDQSELIHILNTSYRIGHNVAKKVPIFSCIKSTPASYFCVNTKPKTPFILEETLNKWGECSHPEASFRGRVGYDSSLKNEDGELYIIIPSLKSYVYSFSNESFYKSFPKFQEELDIKSISNQEVKKALSFFGSFETSSDLENVLRNDPENNDSPGYKSYMKFIKRSKSDYILARAWLQSLLNLENNGFRKTGVGIPAIKGHQCWVFGEALAIRVSLYEELHKKKAIR